MSESAQGSLQTLDAESGLAAQIIGRYVGGALMGLALVALLCTQYLAFRFDYQDALGTPFVDLGAYKVYEPFGVFRWYRAWGNSSDPAISLYFTHVMWGGAICAAAIALLLLAKFNCALKSAMDASRAGHAKANDMVFRFEPTAADGSGARFDPLEQVRLRTGMEVSDMRNLMTMIVDPGGRGLQDQRQKSSRALLVGAGLHVLYAEENKTLAGVLELLSNPQRSITDTLRHLLTTDHDLHGEGWRTPEGETTYTHPVVAAIARDMMNRAEEEMSSVVSQAISYLGLYRDPIVASNRSGDDFRVPAAHAL